MIKEIFNDAKFNDVKIIEPAIEITNESTYKRERFKGKYHEFGELEIKTEFELLKTTTNNKVSYEVVLTEEVQDEEFIIKNILNRLECNIKE